MPTVEILVGPPASGKSTYAREKVREGFIRINKDNLRWMLFNKQYDPENERIVKKCYVACLREAVYGLRDIVLDATHLRYGEALYIKLKVDEFVRHATGSAVEYDIVVNDSFCQVPYEELLKRDSQRASNKQVGPQVLQRMYDLTKKYLKDKESGSG